MATEDGRDDARLGRLQAWMQAVVTHRGGVVAGARSPAARDSLGAVSERFERVVTPSARLSGAERLAIYHRSYFGRLQGVLRETFPALVHLLGERLFDDFAFDYLDHHPPSSHTLGRLAQRLPEHLAATRPDGHLPAARREGWVDLLVELATVERDFLEVWDGPGVEGRPAPSGPALAALAPAAVGALRLRRAPCLRLYDLRFPVDRYLQAVRRGEEPPVPTAAPRRLALTRRRYRLGFVPLTAPQYGLLRRLDGEVSLDAALEGVAGELGCRPRDLTLPARDWLVSWADRAVFELA
jgi:hypothetical protein